MVVVCKDLFCSWNPYSSGFVWQLVETVEAYELLMSWVIWRLSSSIYLELVDRKWKLNDRQGLASSKVRGPVLVTASCHSLKPYYGTLFHAAHFQPRLMVLNIPGLLPFPQAHNEGFAPCDTHNSLPCPFNLLPLPCPTCSPGLHQGGWVFGSFWDSLSPQGVAAFPECEPLLVMTCLHHLTPPHSCGSPPSDSVATCFRDQLPTYSWGLLWNVCVYFDTGGTEGVWMCWAIVSIHHGCSCRGICTESAEMRMKLQLGDAEGSSSYPLAHNGLHPFFANVQFSSLPLWMVCIQSKSVPVWMVCIQSRSVPVWMVCVQSRSVPVWMACVQSKSVPIWMACVQSKSVPVWMACVQSRSVPVWMVGVQSKSVLLNGCKLRPF